MLARFGPCIGECWSEETSGVMVAAKTKKGFPEIRKLRGCIDVWPM